jgi:hypothetical protein
VIARACVVLVAVVALAWLGVMERDERLSSRGLALSGHLSVPGNFVRADSDLRHARFLNPDPTPDLYRSLLYQGAGRIRRSESIAAEVVRREPDNLAAWIQLFSLARGRDPAVRPALAALRRLDPLEAPRG